MQYLLTSDSKEDLIFVSKLATASTVAISFKILQGWNQRVNIEKRSNQLLSLLCSLRMQGPTNNT